MTKFVEERKTASGRSYWVFNPKKYIRDALNVMFQRFDRRDDALEHAERIIRQYEQYKQTRDRTARIEEDTVDGLIAFYKQTTEWKKLKPNSRRLYDLMIRTASQTRIGQANITFGQMQSKSVNPTHADKLYGKIQLSVSSHRAVHMIKVMRKIWFVGKRHGKVQFNPFEKMGLAGLKSRAVLWEPEQVEAFVKQADEMGLWSIGTIAMLCYDLCQRPGDMRQLRWSDFDGQTFTFVQEKTGTEVCVLGSERLVQRLYGVSGRVGTGDTVIALCEATQRPYDRSLYVKYARRVREAAGLPSELQVRDLRRTGATEMAEAGATEDELRSVTGHQSRDVLSIYVRPTKKLAAAGIKKRFAAQ